MPSVNKKWIAAGLSVLAICAWPLRPMVMSTPSDSTLPAVIILSEAPEELELFAAKELQKYMDLLFRHKPRIVSAGSVEARSASSALILGQPSKFALVRDLTQSIDWRESDQTYALVPTNWRDKRALFLAGASAPATLWAAYELIEKWGVRFDLDGDLLAERPSLPPWIQRAVRHSPAIPMRVLTGHNLHVEGPASWGIDDYRKFLDQAAKLRYNGYMFMLRDIGPWFDLEFRGTQKEKADIYGGGWLKEYEISRELVGYEHFKNEGRVFYSPWFRGTKTDAERMRAGPRLVRAIFEHARRRGMKTGVYFELTNLPPEMKEGFAQLTGASKVYESIPKEEWYLKAKEDVTHPLLWDLVETKLRAIQKTYPNLDFYEFGQMEHTSATSNYLPLWKELDRKYGVGQVLNLEEVFAHADRYPVRRNFSENVTGEIEFLWLIDKIFLERGALGKIFPDTSRLLVGNGVTTLEFFPILPKIWPSQIQLDAWLEYGYHRAADKLNVLDSLAKHKARGWMNNCLDEDNNLWLAQNTIEAIHKTVQKAVAVGIEGMEVGHWRVRDVAPAARYMAEACWNPRLTPEEFYANYLVGRVGKPAAATLESAFRYLEQADRYTSINLLGIAFCYPDRLRPYISSPESKSETKLRNSLDLYTSSWRLFEASLEHATPAGRHFVQAWANRTDFSRRYLEMLLLARELGMTWKQARVSDEACKSARQLAQRLAEHVREMVELVARDVQDRSDQGTLISLNYLLYQPALEIQAEILRDIKRR